MDFMDARNIPANPDQCATLNGATAWSSSGDKCLDLFFVAGAMRYHDQDRLNIHFVEAYRENPELAMKLLFYIRDIRGGLGERDIFRRLIRTVAKKWPESAVGNVKYITEYGRWDDLICLTGTKAEKEVVRVIREQLDKDMAALERRKNGEEPDAHISLCAKWMPSSNTSSARTRGQAKVMMRLLKLNEKSYRGMLTSLRSAISLTEHYVTNRSLDRVNYEHVPSQAMLRYDLLFSRTDSTRYEEFMRKVRGGLKNFNNTTLTPDQIVQRSMGFGYEYDYEYEDRQRGGRLPAVITNYRPKGLPKKELPDAEWTDKFGYRPSPMLKHSRYIWGTVTPVHILRRPNSPDRILLASEYDPLHDSLFYRRLIRSRRWKAYTYHWRKLREASTPSRLEYIDEVEKYNSPFHCSDPKCLCTSYIHCPVHHVDSLSRTWRMHQHTHCPLIWVHVKHYRLCSRHLPTRHTFTPTVFSGQYQMRHREEFWKALPGSVAGENAISVIDTSESMQAYGAYATANALGLFHAQHASGPFHNKFITFSEEPTMVKLHGEGLGNHLWQIYQADWGGTTNLEAVFDMLLKMAKRANASRNDMPSSIVIYSDMEFNRSVTNPDETIFEDARKKFEEAGYDLPAVSFHNVNSLTMQTPVQSATMGTTLSSGRTTHHMKKKVTHNTTPLSYMMEVLMSERYECIHAYTTNDVSSGT